MPSQVRKAAANKMSLSLLSRSDEFVNFIDAVYFEGYALKMAQENPSKLLFEYYEFLRNS